MFWESMFLFTRVLAAEGVACLWIIARLRIRCDNFGCWARSSGLAHARLR